MSFSFQRTKPLAAGAAGCLLAAARAQGASMPAMLGSVRARIALAAALLCGAPAAAWAQRNGDVSSGLNDQPTSGEVRSRERADGVMPLPEQQQRAAGTLNQLYQHLMTEERKDELTTAPADLNASTASVPNQPAR